MSNTEKIREQLSAYLDGELSDADRQKVQLAIEADDALAKELRELQAVRDLLGNIPREQAGEQFVSQVLARAERRELIGASPEVEQGRLPWVRWALSAAVLLIVMGIAVVITAVLNVQTFPGELTEKSSIEPVGEIAHNLRDQDRYSAPVVEEKDTVEDLAELAMTVPEAPAIVEQEALTVIALGRDVDVAGAAPKVAAEEVQPSKLPTELLAKTEAGYYAADAVKDSRQRSAGLAVRGSTSEAGEPAVRDELAYAARARSLTPTAATKQLDKGMPTGVVAASETQPKIDTKLAAAHNEVIFTDKLPATQRQVEQVLRNNYIVPLTEETRAKTDADRLRSQPSIQNSNYIQLAQDASTQAQYLAYVTPEQMKNVTVELAGIRQQQVVSQLAIPTGRGRRIERKLGAGESTLRKGVENWSGRSVEWRDRVQQTQPIPLPTRPALDTKAYVALVDTPDGTLRLKESSGQKQPADTTSARSAPAFKKSSRPVVGGKPARMTDKADLQPLLITLNLSSSYKAGATGHPSAGAASREAASEAKAKPRPHSPE